MWCRACVVQKKKKYSYWDKGKILARKGFFKKKVAKTNKKPAITTQGKKKISVAFILDMWKETFFMRNRIFQT